MRHSSSSLESPSSSSTPFRVHDTNDESNSLMHTVASVLLPVAPTSSLQRSDRQLSGSRRVDVDNPLTKGEVNPSATAHVDAMRASSSSSSTTGTLTEAAPLAAASQRRSSSAVSSSSHSLRCASPRDGDEGGTLHGLQPPPSAPSTSPSTSSSSKSAMGQPASPLPQHTVPFTGNPFFFPPPPPPSWPAPFPTTDSSTTHALSQGLPSFPFPVPPPPPGPWVQSGPFAFPWPFPSTSTPPSVPFPEAGLVTSTDPAAATAAPAVAARPSNARSGSGSRQPSAPSSTESFRGQREPSKDSSRRSGRGGGRENKSEDNMNRARASPPQPNLSTDSGDSRVSPPLRAANYPWPTDASLVPVGDVAWIPPPAIYGGRGRSRGEGGDVDAHMNPYYAHYYHPLYGAPSLPHAAASKEGRVVGKKTVEADACGSHDPGKTRDLALASPFSTAAPMDYAPGLTSSSSGHSKPWPTPSDLPLPSTFPFPPSLIPPQPPAAVANALQTNAVLYPTPPAPLWWPASDGSHPLPPPPPPLNGSAAAAQLRAHPRSASSFSSSSSSSTSTSTSSASSRTRSRSGGSGSDSSTTTYCSSCSCARCATQRRRRRQQKAKEEAGPATHRGPGAHLARGERSPVEIIRVEEVQGPTQKPYTTPRPGAGKRFTSYNGRGTGLRGSSPPPTSRSTSGREVPATTRSSRGPHGLVYTPYSDATSGVRRPPHRSLCSSHGRRDFVAAAGKLETSAHNPRHARRGRAGPRVDNGSGDDDNEYDDDGGAARRFNGGDKKRVPHRTTALQKPRLNPLQETPAAAAAAVTCPAIQAQAYLQGIEDLYRRLRDTYEELQQNPTQLLPAPFTSPAAQSVIQRRRSSQGPSSPRDSVMRARNSGSFHGSPVREGVRTTTECHDGNQPASAAVRSSLSTSGGSVLVDGDDTPREPYRSFSTVQSTPPPAYPADDLHSSSACVTGPTAPLPNVTSHHPQQQAPRRSRSNSTTPSYGGVPRVRSVTPNAPAMSILNTVPAGVGGVHSPQPLNASSSSFVAADVPPAAAATSQPAALPRPLPAPTTTTSVITKELREELLKLESQWQRLEELKRAGAPLVAAETKGTQRGGRTSPGGVTTSRDGERTQQQQQQKAEKGKGKAGAFSRDKVMQLVQERKAAVVV